MSKNKERAVSEKPLGIPEAARLLGRNPMTIRRYIAEGAIEAKQPTGKKKERWMINREAFYRKFGDVVCGENRAEISSEYIAKG